jgi:hypothetical protein
MNVKKRIPPSALRALEETGLPFDFELGSRHIKVRLCGQFVAIMPRGSSAKSEGHNKRCMMNTVCQIKRAARAIKEGQAA